MNACLVHWKNHDNHQGEGVEMEDARSCSKAHEYQQLQLGPFEAPRSVAKVLFREWCFLFFFLWCEMMICGVMFLWWDEYVYCVFFCVCFMVCLLMFFSHGWVETAKHITWWVLEYRHSSCGHAVSVFSCLACNCSLLVHPSWGPWFRQFRSYHNL